MTQYVQVILIYYMSFVITVFCYGSKRWNIVFKLGIQSQLLTQCLHKKSFLTDCPFIWSKQIATLGVSTPRNVILTHLNLASLLWGIGKQNSPRCDAAERGVPSGAILFAYRNFIEK